MLPLLLRHFENKYPERPWIIFDKKRQVGVYSQNGISRWIDDKEFYSKTSRFARKDYSGPLFLDSNHMRITRNDQLKSVV